LVSIQIEKSKINGVLGCPSSKSYSHRAIAIASLAEGQSIISNALLSRDTLATLAACKAFGANIHHTNNILHVTGNHNLDTPENIINAENSGTTIRIMCAMSALVKKGFTVLTGDESLRRRPMYPILNALEQLGVYAYSTKMDGTPPLIVRGGGIKGGTAVIDGSVSSQFLSSLLISCIYADSEVTLRIKDQQVSKPYIYSTLESMKTFGVKIDHDPNFLEYYIERNKYKPTVFEIPGDFSTAAVMLAAGLLAGGDDGIIVKDLNFSLPQADSKILDIIRMMEGQLKIDKQKGEITAYGSEKLEGGEFCIMDSPDLLPVISILALKARSQVTISGVAHARLKETDRITNIASQLTKLGAIIKEKKDGLSIIAPRVLKNASLEAFNDHRLFMAFTIASLLSEKSIVSGVQSVDVSYPNFIQDMINLEAKISPMPDRE
jgi:3-phosphoshikimate 1-carboxyvinyltransferase